MTARRRLLRDRIRASRLGSLLGDRGAALVEFVLVLPILLMLVMGIIEFGWWIHVNNVVDQSARAGARRVSVDGAISPDAARAAAAVTNNSGLRPDRTTFTARIQGNVRSTTAANPSGINYACAIAPAVQTPAPPNVRFVTTYEYRPFFPVLDSPIFFGGIRNFAPTVETTVILPTETQWVPGRGPILTDRTLIC